jgi:hypothetical protein
LRQIDFHEDFDQLVAISSDTWPHFIDPHSLNILPLQRLSTVTLHFSEFYHLSTLFLLAISHSTRDFIVTACALTSIISLSVLVATPGNHGLTDLLENP